LGVPTRETPVLAAYGMFMLCTIFRGMISARGIEILFRRLRLYDRLERRAEVRTIQRVMRERYGD
jgi:hypothetical protein